MNIQEKRKYVSENIGVIPAEERQSFAFNFACVLTKNSVGMESGKMASLEEVVSIVRGYNVRADENLKRSVYNFYTAYEVMLNYLEQSETKELTEDFLKDLHAQIVNGLVDGGGLYRNVNIKINGSMHTPVSYTHLTLPTT